MTLAEPSPTPHGEGTEVTEWVIGVDVAMVALAVAEQALPLVTVTVYVPADRPEAVSCVWIGVVFHV